jgi:hypothetical protein
MVTRPTRKSPGPGSKQFDVNPGVLHESRCKNVVIPAKAGIHVASLGTVAKAFRIKMDSRFRGNDGNF